MNNTLYIAVFISFAFGCYGVYKLYMDMNADGYYDETVKKAKLLIRRAYDQHDKIIEDATNEAANMKSVAFTESQKMLLNAKSESDMLIADARIKVETMQAQARKQVAEVDEALASMRQQLNSLDYEIDTFAANVAKSNHGMSIGSDAITPSMEITPENSSMTF